MKLRGMNRNRIIITAVAAVLATLGMVACGKDSKPAAGAGASPSAWMPSANLSRQLADARAATAKYAVDLPAAQRDGYMIITKMMPGMGFHFLNPAVTGFDVTKPAILVYVPRNNGWQLVALEWVFPKKPDTPPLEAAIYGSFAAACHFEDGGFVPHATEAECERKSPDTGSPFKFWHPDLVTLHVWLWYHNPAGLYNGTNPLVDAFSA
jgi:hypothetical protein